MQMRGGVPVNDNKGLEREADVMGGRASGTSEEVAQRRDRGVLSQDLLGTTAVAQLLSVNYYPSGSPTKVGSANVQESNGAIASSVAPSDYDTGSVTNNAVRAVSQEATKVFAKRFIAGHMLNNHLGGPGTDQKNITAITSGQNSAHHAQLEKGAKALVKGGKTISYYTIITKRADFYNSTGTSKLADNLASELKGGYTDTSNGTSFGPVIIPLGPPSAVKKNEVATGMVASGGTTVTVSKSEEYASETAEAIMDVSYSSTLNGYVKSYYGKDEQDVKEGLVKIILLKSPDPMKLSSYFLKWSKDIENHALNGSTLPDFL